MVMIRWDPSVNQHPSHESMGGRVPTYIFNCRKDGVMYESRGDALISRRRFALRLLSHLLLALAFIVFSLGVGILGYLWIEGNAHWHDVTLNMAMIASGIGPIMLPETMYGKIFLALYGAYISVVFAAVLGLVMAPILHRVFHAFHLDEDER